MTVAKDSETDRQGNMNSKRVKRDTRSFRPIVVIGLVLMVWAFVLAAGAILATDDYLKALVIIGAMTCFVSLWMVALRLKKNQK